MNGEAHDNKFFVGIWNTSITIKACFMTIINLPFALTIPDCHHHSSYATWPATAQLRVGKHWLLFWWSKGIDQQITALLVFSPCTVEPRINEKYIGSTINFYGLFYELGHEQKWRLIKQNKVLFWFNTVPLLCYPIVVNTMGRQYTKWVIIYLQWL